MTEDDQPGLFDLPPRCDMPGCGVTATCWRCLPPPPPEPQVCPTCGQEVDA